MTISLVRENVFSTLESFMLPVYLQGSMSKKEEYPETFFTYFIPTQEGINGDNEEQIKTFIVEIAVYSNDIDKMDELSEQIKNKMKEQNFNFVMGGDVASDEPTHTGYMQRFAIIL